MRNLTKVLGLVLIVSACGGSAGFAAEYPEEVKDNFIQSCLAEGGDRDSCECSLDAFTENIDYATFEVVELALRAGLPRPFESFPDLEAALQDCYE
jgi:hypothetical protein